MAETWTAIGLLAGFTLGTLFYLRARIDAFGARIDLHDLVRGGRAQGEHRIG
jgi:hypothetical protein